MTVFEKQWKRDEKLKRSIAAFMGYADIRPMRGPHLYGKLGGRRHSRIPDYTWDYRAIACVWQEVAADDSYAGIQMHNHAHRLFDEDFDTWYEATPREHAEVLATAIVAAMQRRAT